MKLRMITMQEKTSSNTLEEPCCMNIARGKGGMAETRRQLHIHTKKHETNARKHGAMKEFKNNNANMFRQYVL